MFDRDSNLPRDFIVISFQKEKRTAWPDFFLKRDDNKNSQQPIQWKGQKSSNLFWLSLITPVSDDRLVCFDFIEKC